MCNPCGIPDAKFFKDGRKSSGEPKRDKPLEGLKQTRFGKSCENFNKLVLGKKTKLSEAHPRAGQMGLAACALVVVFWLSCILCGAMGIDAAGLVAMLSFFGVHWCAIFSRVMSQGKCRIGLVALACLWVSLIPLFTLLSHL